LKRFSGRASLVELFPQSGRMHQIRVHMAYLRHPVLGDEKYGAKKTFPRMALHAKAVAFVHPIKKYYVEFSSLTPKEFFRV
jgi:23S rRNA pseudouridine1911/1915/1917 synthase